MADKARWSADGRGIRFDPATGRSVGEEFRVTHYEDPVRLLESGSAAELGVGESRIIAPITELSGSIWLLKRGTK